LNAPGNDDLTKVAALSQAIAGRTSSPPAVDSAASVNPGSRNDPDYDGQNMQTAKATFLSTAQKQKTEDYLQSTRTAPLSTYEIKAGWEIPAVLEQSLNSDLPGEIKALINSNVFDTASGRYLLIPQGSRLVGKYDSRISYGQDGVQVIWDRIIFPDASSVDINGMVGLDAHGNSGLRFDVDHHYKRLFGFAALTSAFSAAFDLSQRNTQSALTYPSVTDTASASVGREMSRTGAQITRRNLNVQPTIKVPAGYKFTVRVNRDILFDAPYQPVQANPLPIQPPGQLHRRSAFSTDYGPDR
jgi:type IV secretion system protein TrbI